MVDWPVVAAIVLTIVTASTPLLLAALGEVVAERSGVLNLGVEGMMAIGAVSGFAATHATGSTFAGVIASAIGGMILAVPFAVLVINLSVNQVATGLSLTLFGLGASAMIGDKYVGVPGIKLPQLHIPGLSDIPFIGPVLFGQDGLVYFSVVLTIAIGWFLTRSRGGLVLRAVGDNHDSAHNLGLSVLGVRWAAVLFGGACAGLGGGYLSLGYTPLWTENMTAGRGWIAVALVVFASWRPARVLVGAYLFGAVTILGFHAQGMGLAIPSQFISALPYLATVVVLVIISGNKAMLRANTPACLGKPFVPTR
ncbi:nucleoside ABC transporter membrane protein [Faunimonas pinastri]|uniref:Nucleoside ABC transporter membrane protein n=1 Tax=Faunimonas pinastri TaxID=1855383 RepID=A0A1H9L9Z9_9HYPH|nr:nucleoside ABC transporter membrane protein [Faunimonas pinastri]